MDNMALANPDFTMNPSELNLPMLYADSAPRAFTPTIQESPDDPHRIAREILRGFSHPEGRTLAYYRQEFYVWDGRSYHLLPHFDKERLAGIVKHAVNSLYLSDLQATPLPGRGTAADRVGTLFRGKPVPKVGRGLVGDVAQALGSMVLIEDEAETPFWRIPRPDDPDPSHIMPAANGLIDLNDESPTLLPHTPRFFSTYVLPYDFNPDAPEPEVWRRFLRDQWEDDAESVESLHEVLGYLLTPSTTQHKMFLLIGPPRSGKSTIAEVIRVMLGERNVASTSANTLNGRFGLEPLLGKSVAIMADVRTGSDTSAMTDRLLRIVGGDSVEVDRKNRGILSNVKLQTRFLLIANELPNFRDSSKAITSRYLAFQTLNTISEEDRDPDLLARLTAELPGILNLSIEGRRRLMERRRFLQPASAAHLIADAEAIASPVAEFVREYCRLLPGARIEKFDLFSAWRRWAEERGHPPGNGAQFGKSLKAACPRVGNQRPRTGEGQVNCYTGIDLLPNSHGSGSRSRRGE